MQYNSYIQKATGLRLALALLQDAWLYLES